MTSLRVPLEFDATFCDLMSRTRLWALVHCYHAWPCHQCVIQSPKHHYNNAPLPLLSSYGHSSPQLGLSLPSQCITVCMAASLSLCVQGDPVPQMPRDWMAMHRARMFEHGGRHVQFHSGGVFLPLCDVTLSLSIWTLM